LKRTLLTVLTLFTLAAAAFADPVIYDEPPLAPQSAVVMAQGGSFAANASGFDALFTNPAGFSTGKASFTVLAANPWVYAFPSQETLDGITAIASDPVAGLKLLSPLFTDSGTGVGVLAGAGFVGSGVGIGVIVTNDTFGFGSSLIGTSVDSTITAAAVAGLSLPLHLGPITLTPGADVRPMYRLSARGMGISNFVGLFAPGGSLDDIKADVLAGAGIAFDAGLNVSLGPLTAALVVRDIGNTTFAYSVNSFADTVTALSSFTLPEGTPVDSTVAQYSIPMSFHAGLSFHPDLGAFSSLIDPSVHAEYVIPSFTDLSSVVWNNIHVGADIGVLRFIHLRAGLNQGYLTFGAGIKLLFLDVNVAYFSRELGDYPSARQNQAVTAEVALRF